MQQRHKQMLRSIILDLRHMLAGGRINGGMVRGDFDRELERVGINPDGTIAPFDIIHNPSGDDRWLRQIGETELRGLAPAERRTARRELIERWSYSWINRLVALRAMEARGLIEETLRANPAYGGQPEALYVLAARQPSAAAAADHGLEGGAHRSLCRSEELSARPLCPR